MSYPSALASARLRANFIDAGGNPDSAILFIRAGQVNAVGQTVITSSTVRAEAVGGVLDTPVPVGDDVDLARPLVLEIEAQYGGPPTPTRPRRPERYIVQVTANDVETVTENGQSVKVVYLAKLIRIDGVPLITLGMVKTVNGIRPDAGGNVDLGDVLTAPELAQALSPYALDSEVDALATAIGNRPTSDQVVSTVDQRINAFASSAAFANAVAARVVAILAAGPGIGLAFDGQTLTITNTGGGTSPAPVGAFLSAFGITL